MNSEKDTSRRDFLRGRLLGPAHQEPSHSAQQDHDSPNQSNLPLHTAYLQHFSKRAMACDFEVFFNLNQYDHATEATLAAFHLIDQLEEQLSYYRQESEISRINRSNQQIVPVSSELRNILERAERIHRETNGAFDITSTPLSRAWGFHQRKGAIPSQEQIDAALQIVDASKVELSQEGVCLNQNGLEINLNSIGKGYTLDQTAALIMGFQTFDFVIHGGQSSVVARGSENPADPGAEENQVKGWKVGLSHPFVPNNRLAEITLRNQSLGTSGTARQGFFHQGKRYGHVIDPRTGWPTDHFLSTTVVCNSAALSDALATAFFVMSLDEIQTYCDNSPEVAAIIVVPKSSTGAVRIEKFNFREDSIQIF